VIEPGIGLMLLTIVAIIIVYSLERFTMIASLYGSFIYENEFIYGLVNTFIPMFLPNFNQFTTIP